MQSLTGHTDYVTSIELLDESHFASGGCDKIVIIWDGKLVE